MDSTLEMQVINEEAQSSRDTFGSKVATIQVRFFKADAVHFRIRGLCI